MELQINSLETKIEKMQEMFKKDLEETKKSQLKMNNVINEIKIILEGTMSRVTEKNQPIMNNAITEIKSTLERTNSRITQAEDRISDMEDRMVEIKEAEKKKGEKIKRNEDDLWGNVNPHT